MASRSATRKCQVGVRSVAEAPSWLGLYHERSGRRRGVPSCLAPERSGGAKQLTPPPLIGGSLLTWHSLWNLLMVLGGQKGEILEPQSKGLQSVFTLLGS